MALIKINNHSSEDTAIHGRRNRIINGAMQLAQRGTTATGGSTGLHYGGCDRWRMYQENTAAAYTLSQDSNSPNNFSSSLKIDVTTADGTVDAADRVDLIYRFEGNELQDIGKGTADAKQLTLSFWVSSPKTGTHIVELFDIDNARQISKSYTVSSANTWEKKTITFEGDTSGALDNDNNLSLQISWWLMAGSNFTSGTLSTSWSSNTNANRAVGQVNVMDSTSNNFYLTGVQLEIGNIATPFEHRSYGEELALCQRYYAELPCFSGPAPGTTDTRGYGAHVVQMRTAPTLGLTGVMNITDGYSYDRTQSSASISLITNTKDFSFFNLPNFSSITSGRIHFGPRNQNTNRVTLDSEL